MATRKLALSSGFRSRRTVPSDCPLRKSAATPSCQARKSLSRRLRNCSSTGDISVAKLSSEQPVRMSSGRTDVRRTMPIKMSIGLPAAKQRTQPPVANDLCDDFVDDCISQGFFAVEVMIERSLGDIGGGENCIDAGTLEARSVDLPKCRLQQAFPCTLWITDLRLFLVTT